MNRLKGGLVFGFIMLLPGAAIAYELACDSNLIGAECYFNKFTLYIPVVSFICGFLAGYYTGWNKLILEITKDMPLCQQCNYPVWKSALNLKNRVSLFKKHIKCSNCGTITNELGKIITKRE